MKTRFLIVVGVVGLLGGGTPLLAQTPDGETPAQESVCDVLANATPGLYGLCVAYCEAHDADSVDAECRPSSSKLLDNYNRKKQPGDPPMPCIQPVCPCWSVEQIATFEKYGCNDSLEYGEDGTIRRLITRITGAATCAGCPSPKVDQTAQVHGATAKRFTCYFQRGEDMPISLEISEQEALACRDTLLLFDPVCFQR